MKSPNQFELAHAAETLWRLERYICKYQPHNEYDPFLLSGAANTIDSFIENKELTFFERIPDGNQKTKTNKSTITPSGESEKGSYRSCYD